MNESRRTFIRSLVGGAAGLGALTMGASSSSEPDSGDWFRVSIAEWSFHRALHSGRMDHLDFARRTRNDYGLDAVEYVNGFFKDKARDRRYLTEMKKRADDHGVRSLLIMIDGEGSLGAPDANERRNTIERHKPWVDAAAFLGCHSIRVNAHSGGSRDEQRERVADGLRQLTEYADGAKLNVIVENHGGLSSDAAWLSAVMRTVDRPRCGTLPDFGNFRVQGDEWYDRYTGVRELMPFAKAVSAKSYGFDEHGFETTIDFRRMMTLVRDAGYRGYVGIEYEGSAHSEEDGVRLTRDLLHRLRGELAPRG